MAPMRSISPKVAWQAASDNIAVTAYKVLRNEAVVAVLGPVTAFSDSGLAPSTTYSYQLLACDAAGKTCLRVALQGKRANPWDIGAIAPITGDIRKGDKLQVLLWARLDTDDAKAQVQVPVSLQLGAPPYTAVLSGSAVLTSKLEPVVLNGTALLPLAPCEEREVAIPDEGIARLHARQHALGTADDGNFQSARHDRDVAECGALLQHNAAQTCTVVVEQFGRPHVAGDHDHVVGLAALIGGGASGETQQQPIGEVLQIREPLADVRVRRLPHARAHVVEGALNGRFRG